MIKDIAVPTAGTTLLELLGMGARITFGSQRYLSGDLDGRYIGVGNEFGGLGMWDMDAAGGVDDAVNDLTRDAREHGLDLHGGELPDEEGGTGDVDGEDESDVG